VAADLRQAERLIVEIHTFPEVEHVDVVMGEGESIQGKTAVDRTFRFA
jgi:hypothetical protein